MAAQTSSVAAKRGRDALLKLSAGTSPDTYTTVAGFRMNAIAINGNPVDMTNKGSNGWRELLPDAGVEQVDITGSGVWDATAGSQLLALQSACLNRTMVNVVLVSGSGDKFFMMAVVSQFKRDTPHDKEETFDLTLLSHGGVTYSAN